MLALTACSRTEAGTGAATGSALDRLRETGTVNVGFSNERPYAYQDGADLVGEAPAISGYIFDQLGVEELKPSLFDFGSLIQALNSNRIDVVTAGMYITPERCEQADFGNPEYISNAALAVKAGNPLALTDYASIVGNPEATLAVLNGGVEMEAAKAYDVPQDRLQIVADQQSGLDAVTSGRADAFAGVSMSLRAVAKTTPEVEITDGFTPVVDGVEQTGVGAAVFRKGDDELRKAYNAELKKMIEDGTWLKLVEPYGLTEAEMPDPNATAEQYCQG